MQVKRYFESNLSTKHKTQSFIYWFLLKVLLVKINIDDSKDVPMVFEVINDRGERLRPYEVLKGKLLGKLDKSDVDTYNTIWDEQVHLLQTIDEKEVDTFFRFYFRSKYVVSRAEYGDFDGEYHKSIYLDKWKGRIPVKDTPDAVKEFIVNDFKYYSSIYFKCRREYEDVRYIRFNALNDLDRQYLLIMSALDTNDTQEAEKVNVVSRLFDRYFSILQLTGSYDSNRFTESIIFLNNSIRGKSLEEIEEVFNQKLIEDVGEAKGAPVKQALDWIYFRDAGKRSLGTVFIRCSKTSTLSGWMTRSKGKTAESKVCLSVHRTISEQQAAHESPNPQI